MIKIDTIDKKISDLLIEDGRMSCSRIATRIGGISERAVRYRIDRLLKNGVISVRGNVNAGALELPVCADVFIEVEPGHINEVARILAEFENVSYVACSIGERDISAQVIARNNGEVYTFATEVIGRLPGVRKTTTSILPVRMKDVHQWRIPRSITKAKTDRAKE